MIVKKFSYKFLSCFPGLYYVTGLGGRAGAKIRGTDIVPAVYTVA